MLTLEEYRKLVSYSPETGLFTWIKPAEHGGYFAGDIAGRKKHGRGYLAICYKSSSISAHNLAYMFVTGNKPTKLIYHKNGDQTDNRWCNLTQKTKAMPKPRKVVPTVIQDKIKATRLYMEGEFTIADMTSYLSISKGGVSAAIDRLTDNNRLIFRRVLHNGRYVNHYKKSADCQKFLSMRLVSEPSPAIPSYC